MARIAPCDEMFVSAAEMAPSVLWNDIEWPDGGKGPDDYGVAALLHRYFESVSDCVVNDRWGVPYHGFLTREYSGVEGIQDKVWESTCGLGFSFGYNQSEDQRHSLSGTELVQLLIDVVSKNGNLLINVGPRADGSIPELQRAAMRVLGKWLQDNGSAVYGTRPWIRSSEESGAPVAYTTSEDTVHVHAFDPSTGSFELPRELEIFSEARWSDDSSAEVAEGIVTIPEEYRGQPAAVLSVRRQL